MNQLFSKALSFVLSQEGGFSNDPDDRGGATNKGITQRVYNGFRLSNKLAVRSVKEIDTQEVSDIYYYNYWLKAKCDKMSPVFAVLCFDTAVNMGVSRVSEFLSGCLWSNPDRFLLLRIRKYLELAKNPSQRKFLFGWLSRVFRLFDFIQGV